MKVLGIIPAYNDGDCLENAVRWLAGICDAIHVFDHGSTDNTRERIESMSIEPSYHYVDRKDVPPMDPDGVQSFALWRLLAAFALDQAEEYDWLAWSDADEIVRAPDGRLANRDALAAAEAEGIQVIRPLIREFLPRAKDDQGETNYLLRLRHYVDRSTGHCPRIWKTALTPWNLPAGAHVQDPATGPKVHYFYELWPEGTKVSNNEWLLDHYPFRSRQQATRKILQDRGWITPNGDRRYNHYRRRDGGIRWPMGDARKGMKKEKRKLVMP